MHMDDFKILYTVQPYRVGSKNGKSLAIVIPANIVKKFSIDTSTIFAMKVDENTRTLSLQVICTLNKVLDTTKEIDYSNKYTTPQDSEEGLS
jgi:antitoxin component of MazEF toxin-antitoxin module